MKAQNNICAILLNISMILRAVLCASLLLLCSVQLGAQRINPSSASFASSSTYDVSSPARFSIGRRAAGIAAVSLPVIALGGVAALDADGGLKNLRDSWIPDYRKHADDWLQYSPGALMLALKCVGVQGRSSWGEMATASAAAYVIMGASVNALKYMTSVDRPDGIDSHSFPSGHSATAFMMAGLLTREYGEDCPWVGAGAYTLAAATAAMRIANNKHWTSDVLVGAGLGILSSEAGYLISDILFKKDWAEKELSDDETPSFIGLSTGAGWMAGNNVASRTRSWQTGVEGAWFLGRHIGVGGRMLFSYAAEASSDNAAKFGTMAAGAYFNLPLSERISLGSKLLAGYYIQTDDSFSLSSGDSYYLCGISLGNGLDLGTGLSLSVRLREHYGLRLFADYDLLTPTSKFRSVHNFTLGFSFNILW